MYKITKEYSEKDILTVKHQYGPDEREPLKRLVREYSGSGLYARNGAGLKFGEEDGHSFWTFDPKMGRMEYKFDGTYLYITKYIKIPVRFLKGNYWYLLDMRDGRGFSSLEDLIMDYYLNTEFTRTKDTDMTYAFGCRKYGDYLEKLS